MNSNLIAKFLNICSFIALIFAIVILLLARKNAWDSTWAVYILLLAVLVRMLSFSVKNKALEKENAELKEDLKNLICILENKVNK